MRAVAHLALFASLSIILVACGGMVLPGAPGSVLFQDDFARSSSGWDQRHTPGSSTEYVDGRYRIAVFRPNTDAWGNPGIHVADVRIEVDVHKMDGPDDNLFGVICRYQDAGNFYFLVTSTDGFSGIGQYINGQRQLLSGDAMLPIPGIVAGLPDHHLRAVCDGSQLALYVDSILASQAPASDWASGDVGLMSGTYREPGTDIAFDNFSVLRAGGDGPP